MDEARERDTRSDGGQGSLINESASNSFNSSSPGPSNGCRRQELIALQSASHDVVGGQNLASSEQFEQLLPASTDSDIRIPSPLVAGLQ